MAGEEQEVDRVEGGGGTTSSGQDIEEKESVQNVGSKEDEDEEEVGKTKNLCGECKEAVAKYKCPVCSVRTCSLKCVNAHKARTQCSGVRDKTAYLPMNKLGDREMFSDISFLDDVKRIRDVARKSRPIPPRKDLPPFLKTLRFQARKRGVRLLFVQPGMKRRKENTSCYARAKDQFFWRLEWHFDAVEGTIISKRVHDGDVLSEVLLGLLTLRKDNALEHHKLQKYVKCGLDQITVHLMAHKHKGDQKEMHELDMKKTLSANLIGKTIVEFPVLSVIPKRSEAIT